MNESTFIIADNHDLCRIGFISIIQDHFKSSPIESVTTKAELRKALAMADESIVVIDFVNLGFSEIEEVAILSKAFPQSKWLFVSEKANETFILPLTANFEAANFIFKSNNYDVIASALIATEAGKKYFCSETLHIIMEDSKRMKENKTKQHHLTATELELVQQLAIGKTTREIADQRCLSYHTINTHRKNIFRKADVNSVQELIKFALKNGLVDLTEYYI
ncbi:MAG: helix-turn-helix transcriptional regulator [Bacteroidales bacterium]